MEVKTTITNSSMVQLATYLFRLSSSEDLRNKTLVGFLINGAVLQVALLCLTKNSCLLPIVLISPSFRWLSDDNSNIVPENVAVLMASIFILKVPPQECKHAQDYVVHLAQANRSLGMDITNPICLHRSYRQLVTWLNAVPKCMVMHVYYDYVTDVGTMVVI